jgi:hypothetical protein
MTIQGGLEDCARLEEVVGDVRQVRADDGRMRLISMLWVHQSLACEAHQCAVGASVF